MSSLTKRLVMGCVQLRRHFETDTLPWLQRLHQKEQELQRRTLKVHSCTNFKYVRAIYLFIELEKVWIELEGLCSEQSVCRLKRVMLLTINLAPEIKPDS